MECTEGISAPATSCGSSNSSASESSSSDGANIGKLKEINRVKIKCDSELHSSFLRSNCFLKVLEN